MEAEIDSLIEGITSISSQQINFRKNQLVLEENSQLQHVFDENQQSS